LSSTPLLQISAIAQQLPPLHCFPVPQLVPSPTLLPVSMHTGVPVPHSSVPTWHGSAGVQGALWTHGWQLPALHTWFRPHGVPFGAAWPVSVHVGAPPSPLHEMPPSSHGRFVSGQALPGVHEVHVPPKQTMLVPHEVPSGNAVPVWVQTGWPVSHAVCPG
jgi:hypothetical protein